MLSVVTTIQNNIVHNQFIFNTIEEAESAFVDLIIHEENGEPASDELNGALEEGVWESDNGHSICIGQPEEGNHDTLMRIRMQINEIR